MIVIFYKWKVRDEARIEFIQAWSDMTKCLQIDHGSLGSRLHRTEDGQLVGYAQWPDRATLNHWRDAELTPEETSMLATMKAGVVTSDPPVVMDVLADLLHFPQ